MAIADDAAGAAKVNHVAVGSDPPELRKARGAFLHPPMSCCRYVVECAVRDRRDVVLEPSCGEAAFLLSAAARLHELGGGGQLHGVEVHAASARAARQMLDARGIEAEIRVGDFFEERPRASYDAVVGNPPYVRYQDSRERRGARSVRRLCERACTSRGSRRRGLRSRFTHASS